MTRMLTCPPDGPTAAILSETAAALRAGRIVILPTDTVYGAAADPRAPGALERLFRLKGRPADKPIALLAADARQVEAAAELGAAGRALAARFWPGALTLVLRCGGAWEGYRVPDHPAVQAVLRAAGSTLRVTSANRSGEAPALTAAQAAAALDGAADLALDAGPAPGGRPSTVFALGPGRPRILREGPIPAAAVLAVWQAAQLQDGQPPSA